MKKNYLKIGIAIFLLGMICSPAAKAQNSELKWAIGLHANAFEAKTTVADDFFKFEFGQMGNPGFGISLRKYLSRSFDISLHVHEGDISQSNETTSFNNQFWLPSLRLKYKFANGYIIKNEDAFIGPFLSLGAGVNMMTVNARDETNGALNEDVTEANIYGGAGIRFRLNDYVSFEWETGINMPGGYNLFENIDGDPSDAMLQHSLALVISLGAHRIATRRMQLPVVA